MAISPLQKKDPVLKRNKCIPKTIAQVVQNAFICICILHQSYLSIQRVSVWYFKSWIKMIESEIILFAWYCGFSLNNNKEIIILNVLCIFKKG